MNYKDFVTFSVTVPPDYKNWLDKAARKHNLHRTDIIRYILREFIYQKDEEAAFDKLFSL